MTVREKLVVRILLLIARIVSEDAAVRSDLRHISNHLQVKL
jgi:hypothetical protein